MSKLERLGGEETDVTFQLGGLGGEEADVTSQQGELEEEETDVASQQRGQEGEQMSFQEQITQSLLPVLKNILHFKEITSPQFKNFQKNSKLFIQI